MLYLQHKLMIWQNKLACWAASMRISLLEMKLSTNSFYNGFMFCRVAWQVASSCWNKILIIFSLCFFGNKQSFRMFHYGALAYSQRPLHFEGNENHLFLHPVNYSVLSNNTLEIPIASTVSFIFRWIGENLYEKSNCP